MKPSKRYKIRKLFKAYENERLTGKSVDEYYEVLKSIMKRIFGNEWKTIFDEKR